MSCSGTESVLSFLALGRHIGVSLMEIAEIGFILVLLAQLQVILLIEKSRFSSTRVGVPLERGCRGLFHKGEGVTKVN